MRFQKKINFQGGRGPKDNCGCVGVGVGGRPPLDPRIKEMDKLSGNNTRSRRDKKLKNNMKIPNFFFFKIPFSTNNVYSALYRFQDKFLK